MCQVTKIMNGPNFSPSHLFVSGTKYLLAGTKYYLKDKIIVSSVLPRDTKGSIIFIP